jgi:hypothetical protein
VEIAFSIDDIEKRFEYQRTNAAWQTVCYNLDRFRDLKEIHNNIKLQICTTVNVFNVRYLDQLAKWLDYNTDGFNFVYWNLMHDAWYFSIACLPESAKQSIVEHLKSSAIPQQWRIEIERICEFMTNGASTDGFITTMKIADLDRKRNTDFASVAPEMAQLINYDKNKF